MSKAPLTLFIIVAAEYYHYNLSTWVEGAEATQADAVARLKNEVRDFMRWLNDPTTEEELDELMQSDQLTWDDPFTVMGDDWRRCKFDDDDGLLRTWKIHQWQDLETEVPS